MREGQKVGDYTLVARIGAGGMGETWLAARPGLDKKVVIKMILPELAAIPQASQYFSAESKLGARLHHSNIVNLVDRGSGYIVLEYVEGIDLERLLGAHRNLSPNGRSSSPHSSAKRSATSTTPASMDSRVRSSTATSRRTTSF